MGTSLELVYLMLLLMLFIVPLAGFIAPQHGKETDIRYANAIVGLNSLQ